ncbi:MAG TPA: transposase [Sphingobacteriaceae bacterium]|nr:transposase [Sphingobacteriaceae bacterium]
MSRLKFDFDDKDNLNMIEEMARDGLDDMQIAEKIGYNKTYFSELKNLRPKLTEALKKGRKPLNFYVESSLFKRAIGLKVKSTTTKQLRNKETGEIFGEEVVTTETELPPDTAAMAFWLKQRKHEKWNKEPDKSEVTVKGFLDFLKETSNER